MTWREFPPIEIEAPVLALAAVEDSLWAAGLGGVANFRDNNWHLQLAGLKLSAVTALASAGGWLHAGGPEGIARSTINGTAWSMAQISGSVHPVNVILPSPNFSNDRTLLAGTFGGGVLRSDSAGQAWKPANFGLQNYEVNTLTWRADDTVLAATADGLYHSPNGGRAWKSAAGSEGKAFVAVTFLADGSAVAALETGELIRSTDAGVNWKPYDISSLPKEVQVMGLFADPHGGLYLATSTGTYFLINEKCRKVTPASALSLAATEDRTFFGMPDGILFAGSSQTTKLPTPPLHDLRNLFVVRHRPHVSGVQSGLLAFTETGWQELDGVPVPLTLATSAPDGSLLVSGPEGLLRSQDNGQTWESLVAGTEGMVAYMTFRRDGFGWAASADGSRLLCSPNYGRVWKPLPTPFGVLPVVALQAAEGVLMAATYDARRKVIQFLYSHDEGKTWQRGAESRSDWAVVATCRKPAVLTAGQLLFIYQKDGTWSQVRLTGESGEIVRVASDGKTLLALTTTRLIRSTDLGQTWTQVTDLPCDKAILDIDVAYDTLYVLFSEGRLWSRPF